MEPITRPLGDKNMNKEQAEAEQFKARFNAFKPRYEEAREAAELATRQFAPGFNIFHFLEVQRREKFHSDFIAYLLNPRSSHGQGHLFLQTFFQSLKPVKPALHLPDVPLNHGNWLVQREVPTSTDDGNGYMDIVLRNPPLKALYVIENKVDADEQPGQIACYADYLKRQENEYPNQGLLFLTLDGHDALSAEGKPHHTIAYHSHICAWLELALPKVEAATVRETVQQYLDLIRSL
jgi:hypothetical protein